MPISITMPQGRLVGGHPMVSNLVMDDRTNPPTQKLQVDGVTPRRNFYLGVAIPKGTEAHWNQTVWGAQFVQEAAAGWVNGEFNAPTFAWKVVDGDSAVPNRNGKKPCEREGYPGHWVINCSTEIGIKCYHVGKYEPIQQIQDKNEIKAGDYCRVVISVKANNPSQSPGVYVNPELFELSRAGEQIMLGTGPSAAEAFGGAAPTNTTTAPPANTNATTTAAHDFLNNAPPVEDDLAPPPEDDLAPPPEEKYLHNGKAYTYEKLIASKWKPAQIEALPRA